MRMRFPGGLAKALTLSYDDGVEQDKQLIEILNAHGLRATFNLNSGLWAQEGTVYAPGTIHRRMTQKQAEQVYDTKKHEVAVHCLTHESLPELPPERKTQEILLDRINLEKSFGGFVRGAAYPFGTFDDASVAALAACGIQYCRTVQSTHQFDIPSDWLRLNPTCHHDDPLLMQLCDQFLAKSTRWGSCLFYLWGHAYEFEEKNHWQVIRDFAQKMGNRTDIWYATNIEICDYVSAYHQLRMTADGRLLHNPTDTTLWVEMDNQQVFVIHPGETLTVR